MALTKHNIIRVRLFSYYKKYKKMKWRIKLNDLLEKDADNYSMGDKVRHLPDIINKMC